MPPSLLTKTVPQSQSHDGSKKSAVDVKVLAYSDNMMDEIRTAFSNADFNNCRIANKSERNWKYEANRNTNTDPGVSLPFDSATYNRSINSSSSLPIANKSIIVGSQNNQSTTNLPVIGKYTGNRAITMPQYVSLVREEGHIPFFPQTEQDIMSNQLNGENSRKGEVGGMKSAGGAKDVENFFRNRSLCVHDDNALHQQHSVGNLIPRSCSTSALQQFKDYNAIPLGRDPRIEKVNIRMTDPKIQVTGALPDAYICSDVEFQRRNSDRGALNVGRRVDGIMRNVNSDVRSYDSRNKQSLYRDNCSYPGFRDTLPFFRNDEHINHQRQWSTFENEHHTMSGYVPPHNETCEESNQFLWNGYHEHTSIDGNVCVEETFINKGSNGLRNNVQTVGNVYSEKKKNKHLRCRQNDTGVYHPSPPIHSYDYLPPSKNVCQTQATSSYMCTTEYDHHHKQRTHSVAQNQKNQVAPNVTRINQLNEGYFFNGHTMTNAVSTASTEEHNEKLVYYMSPPVHHNPSQVVQQTPIRHLKNGQPFQLQPSHDNLAPSGVMKQEQNYYVLEGSNIQADYTRPEKDPSVAQVEHHLQNHQQTIAQKGLSNQQSQQHTEVKKREKRAKNKFKGAKYDMRDSSVASDRNQKRYYNTSHHLQSRNEINGEKPVNHLNTVPNSHPEAVNALYHSTHRPPLSQLLGHVRRLSRDQVGCRLLQQSLDEDGPEAATAILREGLPFLAETMTDPFGNYLFQKILEKISMEERLILVKTVSPRLVSAALNLHGTRSVQKVVEMSITDEATSAQKNAVAQAVTKSLTPAAARLCIDSHGNHVIQRILQKLPLRHSKFVFDAVANSVGDVARHRHGCCVIQRCLDSATSPARSNLVRRIVEKALDLMQDAYGNYVVQYVLDVCGEEEAAAVCETVIGKVSLLAIQKFSSNVMEKCLERSNDWVQELYLRELSVVGKIRELMTDPFGNYVVQRALSVATHAQAVQLVEAMRPHLSCMQNTAGGRRILAKICRRFPNFNLNMFIESNNMNEPHPFMMPYSQQFSTPRSPGGSFVDQSAFPGGGAVHMNDTKINSGNESPCYGVSN